MNKTWSHGAMGMSKHRGSGWKHGAGKSPKFRANAKREAEHTIRKRVRQKWFSSVKNIFHDKTR